MAMALHTVKVSSPHGSPIIKFYDYQTSSQNSDGWGIKILQFLTNDSLYLTNDTR